MSYYLIVIVLVFLPQLYFDPHFLVGKGCFHYVPLVRDWRKSLYHWTPTSSLKTQVQWVDVFYSSAYFELNFSAINTGVGGLQTVSLHTQSNKKWDFSWSDWWDDNGQWREKLPKKHFLMQLLTPPVLSPTFRQSMTCWVLARRTAPQTRRRSELRTFSPKWTRTTTANWPRTSSWKVACRTRSCPRCWHHKCRATRTRVGKQSLIRYTAHEPTTGEKMRRTWGRGSLSWGVAAVITGSSTRSSTETEPAIEGRTIIIRHNWKAVFKVVTTWMHSEDKSNIDTIAERKNSEDGGRVIIRGFKNLLPLCEGGRILVSGGQTRFWLKERTHIRKYAPIKIQLRVVITPYFFLSVWHDQQIDNYSHQPAEEEVLVLVVPFVGTARRRRKMNLHRVQRRWVWEL